MEVSGSPREKFKAYLLMQHENKFSSANVSSNEINKESAYGLLVKIVAELWKERPENPLESLVDLGEKILKSKLLPSTEKFDQQELKNEEAQYDAHEIKEICDNLRKTIALFKSSSDVVGGQSSVGGSSDAAQDAAGQLAATGEHLTCPVPDLVEEMFYFRRVGIGMSEYETMTIWISMRQLVELYESTIRKIRFWGKINGVERDYYIIETEMEGEEEDDGEGEDGNENDEEQQDTVGAENGQADNEEEDDREQRVDVNGNPLPSNEDEFIPKPLYKKEPVPPSEVNVGPNRYTYFYCNDSSIKDWKKMPSVSPSQINESRKMKYFFTGNPLKIVNERTATAELNILRAQIARISSACHVSPVGFYVSNDEDSEDESDGGQGSNQDDFRGDENLICNENIDFEEIPLAELSEPGLSNWCHHAPHILPQGRCVWWNPALSKNEKDGSEDEDGSANEEGRSGEDEDDDALFGSKNMRIEPEVGPPLLTSLSEDLPLNGCPAWTIHLRCADQHQKLRTGLVLLKSQLWSGSYALARAGGRWHCNVYIGWGIKYEGTENFAPQQIAQPMLEFPAGKEIREEIDPTVEEEMLEKAAERGGKDGGASDDREGSEGDDDDNEEENDDDDEDD